MAGKFESYPVLVVPNLCLAIFYPTGLDPDHDDGMGYCDRLLAGQPAIRQPVYRSLLGEIGGRADADASNRGRSGEC